MEITKYLNIGQIVKSKNGRDRGKVFVITKIVDEDYVMIVNGENRTIDNPKKKKVKHLTIYNKVFDEIKTKELGKYQYNDAYIRRILKPYTEIELEKKEVSIYE